MDQYIGRLLDNRYEILEIIGTGGMAVVYKARCHRLNRLVAIKILKDEFARDEEFRRRFHAEGEAVAMLSHANIVQVYDVSSSDNANFIVMELIDGISLKQYMEKKGVLNWKETLHFAMQIAKGLDHAHGRGIVHRDIKPHNVMVLKNGSVKVMDFGIARVMNKSNTLTKEALGSVHYISPEQAKGGYTDNRSDLYSLSVVMYEMMTGRPPYDGESAVAVAIQHINGGAALPSSLNPNIPKGLEQIIMKGMALEVKDRYASAAEMLQEMEEFRKNPAIVFDHPTILDDATRAIPVTQAKRTTAEKVVQAKTGVKPTRTAADTSRTAQTGASGLNRKRTGTTPSNTARNREAAEAARRAQQRRAQEEQQRAEEQRSRVATTAIVVCSAVAIIAIIVFLVALFNGALLSREQQSVEVPYLVGYVYSEDLINQYPDLNFRLMPQEYDANYEKGRIMRQEPLGGNKVTKGTEIRLTVSLGEEPEVKIMENLVGVTQAQAESFLDGQGFQVLVREEPSSEYPEGQVTRTDPEAGTQLTEGQVVNLWISTGPDIITGEMPNVVGMDVEAAKTVLDKLGFDSIRVRPVESDKPAGTVVYQSENEGVEIDVTTEILLEVSEGPPETEPPTTEATQPPETEAPTEPQPVETVVPESTETVNFALPESTEPFEVSIYQGSTEVINIQNVPAGTMGLNVDLTGTGIQVYDLYINGEMHGSKTVEFKND